LYNYAQYAVCFLKLPALENFPAAAMIFKGHFVIAPKAVSHHPIHHCILAYEK